MHCPFCHHEHSRVIDSRVIEAGTATRRRRECTHCQGRFTTLEKAVLLVVKRNGVRVRDELDQIHIPDPVAQELCRLRGEVEKLKEQLATTNKE